MTDSLTTLHAFGPCAGDLPILAVRDGMPVTEALTQACEYLKGVSAGAAELVENGPPHLRALARHVEHASEIARALVEASVAGLARAPIQVAGSESLDDKELVEIIKSRQHGKGVPVDLDDL